MGSISRRLMVSLGLVLGLSWLVAVAAAALVMRHEMNEVFDSALQETAQRLLPLAVDDLFNRETLDATRAMARAGVPRHEEYLTYQVRDDLGRILLRSHDAREEAFDVPLARGFAETADLRVYTEAAISDTVFVHVAEPLAHRRQAVFEGAMALLLPLLLLIPLSAILIAAIVRRALHPVRVFGREIERRGGGNLDPLGEAGLPSEIAPIARAVDRLLERLGAALAAERAFSADSAHELRTPIAAALAQVQRLRAELGDGPHAERTARIEATLRRLHALVDKLLQLARTEAGLALAASPVDLLPALRLLVDDFSRREDTAGRIRFDDGGHTSLVRRIDIDAFGIVVNNLIENAVRHGAAGGDIRVSIDQDGNVHVANDGPVVPEAMLGGLTRRFARGRTEAVGAGHQGAGLGLAIAAAVMGQSGGRLELHSPAIGGAQGFEAVVGFDPD